MMRLLIDARMLLGRFSGVPRFVTRLVDELAAQEGLHVTALLGDEPYAPWIGRTDIEMVRSDFSRGDRSPLRRWAWESFRAKHWIERSGADLFHATWNSGVPPRCPIPTVLTVHDLIPWRDRVRGVRACVDALAYRRAVRASARRATRVTTVSDFVRGDVLQTLGLDPARIHTVYNGGDAGHQQIIERPCAELKDRPFILYVGGLERRKNIELLFRGMADYQRRFGPLELRLTGDESGLSPEARVAIDALGDRSSVRFLGQPTDVQIARLYQEASVLVLPSRAEGFGLPVIEAMAHGCPVVAARAGSLPEIVGEAGLLVDVDDCAGLSDAMRRIITEGALRDQLVESGRQRAARFTWSGTAARLRRIYAAALHANTPECFPAVSAHLETLRRSQSSWLGPGSPPS